MTDLVDVLNGLLSTVFEIASNLTGPLLYITMVMVTVGIFVHLVFLVNSIIRPKGVRR